MDEKALKPTAIALYEVEMRTPCKWETLPPQEQEYWLASARAAIAAYLDASGDARDKERLAWLVASSAYLSWSQDEETCCVMQWNDVEQCYKPGPRFTDWSAAIDAARAGHE